MTTLLVTGFGPFRDITWNPTGAIVADPAWQAELKEALAKDLPSVDLRFSVLPVVRGAILEEGRKTSTEAYLAFGVDSKSERVIRIETAARNFCRDEAGEGTIDETGSEWQRSVLPCHSIVEALRDAVLPFGIESGADGTCGSYICNETYYRILASGKPGVFVHTPRIPPERKDALQRALLSVAVHLAKTLLGGGR